MAEIILSVVVPVYNVEKYLDKCLQSILDQTYTKLEVICIDDGSTDSSPEILKRYADKDSRIHVYKTENRGAGAARNLGITKCNGEYVHFVDADDWIDSDSYSEISDDLEKTDTDVFTFNYYTFDDKTKEEKIVDKIGKRADGIPAENISFEGNEEYFLFNTVVPWNKIYSVDFIRRNKLQFDEIACANDRTFYFHMLLCNPRIRLLTIPPFYHYRINNETSLTGAARCRNFGCHFQCFENIHDIYKGQSAEIQKMILDLTMRDFMNFYRKNYGENKWIIYNKLHEYFKTMDLSILEDDIYNYNWYPEYKIIHESPYFLGEPDPDFCIYNKSDEDRGEVKEECTRLKEENERLLNELNELRNGETFKVGKAVLYIPRKMMLSFKDLKDTIKNKDKSKKC